MCTSAIAGGFGGLKSMATVVALMWLGLVCCSPGPLAAGEADYFSITDIPLPANEVLEISATCLLPAGELAVGTRRGEIWLLANPLADGAGQTGWSKLVEGMNEVLGLAVHPQTGLLYAVQRGEVTEIQREDSGRLTLRTVNDAWGLSGDYHEYAFGSRFDRDGYLWVTLCLTGSSHSNALYRGWALRVAPSGEMIPTCSGIRSPGGVGEGPGGFMFYTDNQGLWNGTCSLRCLTPRKFMGNPSGNKWYAEPAAAAYMGPQPNEPESGGRMMSEWDRIPELEPPAINFPYNKMGKSAAGVVMDNTSGKFGPFVGQVFVTDQSASTVMRCDLEQVDGQFQGACFPFLKGFASGSLTAEITPDGSLFVGGTNRGWGSVGTAEQALERVRWTGQVPFEVHQMRALPSGFRLTFTMPVDKTAAGNPANYNFRTYTYIYQSGYGSPEVDETTPIVQSAVVSDDGLSVELTLPRLLRGHVHELVMSNLQSASGLALLHPQAYYTVNRIPAAWTHRVSARADWYRSGPQQASPPDGELAADTLVRVIRESGSYCEVTCANGIHGFVTAACLAPLPSRQE